MKFSRMQRKVWDFAHANGKTGAEVSRRYGKSIGALERRGIVVARLESDRYGLFYRVWLKENAPRQD